MKKLAFKLTHCRLCRSKKLKGVIDLGKSPPPNTLLKKNQLNKYEPFFPLVVNFCKDCGQAQLSHVVSPRLMFQNYPYVSSTSHVMVDHFEQYAKTVFTRLRLKKGDFVVEIGSNDGVLLKFFEKLGVKILGIDPAKNIATLANKEGIPTLPRFFNSKLAKQVAKKYGKAKLIAANNVFAHIHDLGDVVAGTKEILDKHGVFIIEFPYLMNLIDDNVFDSIYHEHLSYLSVRPLERFFKGFGMEIFNVVKTPVQGGSIRVFVKKQGGNHKPTKAVTKFLGLEKKKKLDQIQTYLEFAKNTQEIKRSLNTLLAKLKKQNKKIVGYGAPGRSTTLLNYFGIDTKTLDYIVDDNPNKHGLYTPGTHIPIFSVSQIERVNPDYLLILSWNFAKPIMSKLADFKYRGGRFIIPIPKPYIV